LILIALMLLLFSGISALAGDSTGTVFIVFAIDTEPLRPNPWFYSQRLDFASFDPLDPEATVPQIMDTEWRRQFCDSFGNYPRFTWFLMTHEAFVHSPDSNRCAVYDAMTAFHDELEQHGDELAWHYHHVAWTDIDHDGKSAWNQILTFDGTKYGDISDIELAENQLNALLTRRSFFPAAFRSGWVWENNYFSRWLENVVPFDFSAYPPNSSGDTTKEPRRNIYDWSGAPRGYSGYHPHRDDYRKCGQMNRWIFRTIAPNTHREWEKIIRTALTGRDQILCFTGHSYDRVKRDIEIFLPELLLLAKSEGIRVKFATASEAATAIAGRSDTCQFKIKMTKQGHKIIIQTNKSIFQACPYCVAIDSYDSVYRIYPRSESRNSWTYVPAELSVIEIVCAAVDLSGRRAVVRHKLY